MKRKIIRNTLVIVAAAVILTFLSVTFLMYTHSVDLLKLGTENEAETLKAAIDAEGTDFLETERLFQESRWITGQQLDGQYLSDDIFYGAFYGAAYCGDYRHFCRYHIYRNGAYGPPNQ